jgi:hypothetical protein
MTQCGPNPNAKPPEVRHFSEYDLQKAGLRQKIADTYLEYCQTHSYEEAQRMVKEEFTSDSLVASIEFTESGRSFWIEYTDGQRCNMPVVIGKFYGDAAISSEDRMAIRRNEVPRIQVDLRRNYFIVFGYSGPTDFRDAGDAQLVMQVIEKLKNGTLTAAVTRDQLQKILEYDGFVTEILGNVDKW